jgi:hypothetical protein
MQYKTIILELLKQQTELYEQLRVRRRLLPTLESWALELRTSHHNWMETLSQVTLGSDPLQIKSEALKRALEELEARLPSASQPDEDEALSLSGAIAFLLNPKPRD